MLFDKNDEGYPDGEEPLHFYYNREERIKKAPKNVQDYYSGNGPHPPHGLFKTLISSRTNRVLFMAVCACVIIVLFSALLGSSPDKKRIGSVPVQLSAFVFEDSVYVSIRFLPHSAGSNLISDPVTASLSFINADNQISGRQVIRGIYTGKEEFLRTKVSDYDIIRIQADIQIGENRQTLTSSVQRR